MTPVRRRVPDNAAPPRLADFLAAGIDHRTAGQELRDRVCPDAAALAAFYRDLRGSGLLQPVLMATCDRNLVAAFAPEPERGGDAVLGAMAAAAGLPRGQLQESFFVLTGDEALGHLFAIAASLESRVVGEPEVLGQMKAAYGEAEGAGGGGAEMRRVFDAAFAAGKRVRSETPVGENAVSIAAAARQVAGEVLGTFEDAAALVIGAGEIAVLVAERLAAHGLTDFWVADPLPPRAEALSARLGAHRMVMGEVELALEKIDVVIAGLGGAAPAITKAAVAQALKRRRYRPVFLLDAAVPADIEPGVGDLDAAYLFTLHDLERIALAGRESRSRTAAEARAIVAEEVAAFVSAEERRAGAPLVATLRARFEEVRRKVVEENPDATAEEATRRLVNRLLHEPSRQLRDLASAGESDESPGSLDRDLVARLFGVSAGDVARGHRRGTAGEGGKARKE